MKRQTVRKLTRDVHWSQAQQIAARKEAAALRARVAELEGLMWRTEPFLDAIICYASTMDEHEPNQLAFDFRNALNGEKS